MQLPMRPPTQLPTQPPTQRRCKNAPMYMTSLIKKNIIDAPGKQRLRPSLHRLPGPHLCLRLHPYLRPRQRPQR